MTIGNCKLTNTFSLAYFFTDAFYVRDALLHGTYQLYKNNFLDTTRHNSLHGDYIGKGVFSDEIPVCGVQYVGLLHPLHGDNNVHRQNCLNGDLLASDYFEDLALLIRHNNHNTPFKSNSLYLHNPKLVIDVDSFDEDENEIKTEDIKKEVVVPRKRDKDVEDLNALLHISVSHVPRTKNYNCFDNEVIGPILNHFSKVLHLNDKDRQLFVDDIYYRCMHNLLQAQQQSAIENKFKLTLSNLRSSLYTYYPSHFVKTHDQVDLYEEFEDYKPVKRYTRIKVKIKNCMQEPEYKLERANPHNRNIYYQEHDTRHMAKYRHQIYCRRKYIQDLKFDFKKHACSSLLSVML
jgi:hypothetical protein